MSPTFQSNHIFKKLQFIPCQQPPPKKELLHPTLLGYNALSYFLSADDASAWNKESPIFLNVVSEGYRRSFKFYVPTQHQQEGLPFLFDVVIEETLWAFIRYSVTTLHVLHCRGHKRSSYVSLLSNRSGAQFKDIFLSCQVPMNFNGIS